MQRYFLLCGQPKKEAFIKRAEYQRFINHAEKLATKYKFTNAALSRTSNGFLTQLAGLSEPTSHTDKEDWTSFTVNDRVLYLPKETEEPTEAFLEVKAFKAFSLTTLYTNLNINPDNKMNPNILWTQSGIPILSVNGANYHAERTKLTEISEKQYLCSYFL